MPACVAWGRASLVTPAPGLRFQTYLNWGEEGGALLLAMGPTGLCQTYSGQVPSPNKLPCPPTVMRHRKQEMEKQEDPPCPGDHGAAGLWGPCLAIRGAMVTP